MQFSTILPKCRSSANWCCGKTAITSAGAERLRKFHALQYLDLDKTAVKPEALRNFARRVPK